MSEAFDAYCSYLREKGVNFEVAQDLAKDPDHDATLLPDGARPRIHTDLTEDPIREFDHPDGALGSDHATFSVAWEMKRQAALLAGKTLLDIGCGTGLLAICAARAGAKVVATDIDPEAIRLSEKNASENGVTLDVRHGSLADPIEDHERFDWVIANLPHKPCPDDCGLPLGQHGGPDGVKIFFEVLPDFLRMIPEGGNLLFFAHSLPSTELLLEFGKHFDLLLKRWKIRWIQDGEYPSAMNHFLERHENRSSFLWHEENRRGMVACIWHAVRKAEV